MNTTTKMTLGILGGIGAGFCLGLLTSPDKGSNNRKKAMNMAGNWTHKLTHLFSSDGQDHHESVSSNGTGKSRVSNRRTAPKRRS